MFGNRKNALWAIFALAILSTFWSAAASAQCTITCSAAVPATGQTNVSIAFEGDHVACGGCSLPSFLWSFGDGNTSTAPSPTHTYTQAGTYNWQLTVTAGDVSCTRSGSISISSGGGITPSAGTYSGTTSGGRPFSVTVNGSSQVTSWTIGHTCYGTGTVTVNTTCSITNGSFTCGTATCAPFLTSTQISGTFTSSTAVSGNATMRVTPNQFTSCCTQTPTFSATLSSAPLSASAQASPTSGTAPLLVSFTGSASGGTAPYSYVWDFGDCTGTTTTQNPSHQYLAGNWTAIVTVTDSANTTASAAVGIVAEGPVIDSITPNTGSTVGGESVTINGSNLGGASSVTFGGTAAQIDSNTGSSIVVTTPSHAAGSVDVMVTATAGTTTLQNGFTYNLPPFGAPGALTATAVGTSQVSVTWNPVADADHYEVARSSGSGFTIVAAPAGTGYTDTNVTANMTYVYKVRAVNASAVTSAYSAPDVATTIVFPDDPVMPAVTIVKAAHVTTLRTAANAMRIAAGLGTATFTDPPLDAGFLIRAIHINDLRAAMNAARSALGLASSSYTDPTLDSGSTVRAPHIQEIRAACK